MKSEYIICSSIHFNDGKKYSHQPKNITSGFVIAGRRHHNCYSTLQAIGVALGMDENQIMKNSIEKIDRESQGFITNLDRHVDRKEGFKIALAAGQLLSPSLYDPNEENVLTSECLW